MIDFKNLRVNIESKILKSEKVVIVPHNVVQNNVDFDGIGSSIGLSLIPKKMNKDSFIIASDSLLSVDPGVRMIIDENKKEFNIINHDKYQKIAKPNDLFILTDVNKTYLVSVNDYLTNPDNIIIIDHHDDDKNTVKSNSIFIDSKCSSASEVVVRLLHDWKIDIPPQVANCLYAGIFLDTARLSKNCSPNTMYSVGQLLESGADINRVNEFFREDFLSDRRVNNLINNTRMINCMIAIIDASEDEEYTRAEIAKAADHALKFGADATFVIGKIDNGVISVSARATGKIHVGEIMKKLGGGGNPFSAYSGIENGTIESVEKKLIKVLKPSYYITGKKD